MMSGFFGPLITSKKSSLINQLGQIQYDISHKIERIANIRPQCWWLINPFNFYQPRTSWASSLAAIEVPPQAACSLHASPARRCALPHLPVVRDDGKSAYLGDQQHRTGDGEGHPGTCSGGMRNLTSPSWASYRTSPHQPGALWESGRGSWDGATDGTRHDDQASGKGILWTIFYLSGYRGWASG
jgi:hypothetical protein